MRARINLHIQHPSAGNRHFSVLLPLKARFKLVELEGIEPSSENCPHTDVYSLVLTLNKTIPVAGTLRVLNLPFRFSVHKRKS